MTTAAVTLFMLAAMPFIAAIVGYFILGENSGMRTVALITSMETVLGNSAGNALEVSESIEVLEGGGPEDIIEVTLALAQEMLELCQVDLDPREILASGKPMEVFERILLSIK